MNNDGSAFASYVQTKPLDAGDRNRFKKITKISLDGEWSGDAHLALGFSENVNQAPTWVVDQPLANEIFPDEFGVQSQGVFVHLKIYSEALGANWLISGAKVYGEYTGKLS